MVLSCPDRPVHHCHQRNMSCWSCPVLIVLSITVITETCPAGLVLSWSSCPSLSSKKRFLLVLSCPDHPIHHYHQRNCWSCPACPVLIVLSITIIKETCPAGVILLVLSWSSCPSLSSKKHVLLVLSCLSCPDRPVHHYHQRNVSCWCYPACPVLIVKEMCPVVLSYLK